MCAYPQTALPVGDDGVDSVVGQTLLSGQLFEMQVFHLAGVAHLVDAASCRGQPHIALGILEDVAYLKIVQRAVRTIVVMIGLGVGDQFRRIKHHDAVSTSHKDVTRPGLTKFGDVAHQRTVFQKPAEPEPAVALRFCQTEGSGIDGYPHPMALVADDVKHFSRSQGMTVFVHMAIGPAIDENTAPARSYPAAAFMVDTDRQHVIIDADVFFLQ